MTKNPKNCWKALNIGTNDYNDNDDKHDNVFFKSIRYSLV